MLYIFNYILLLILLGFIIWHFNKTYPRWAIIAVSEPINRFLLYMIVYAVSYYDNLLALVLLIAVVLLNIDYYNLSENFSLLHK